MGEFNESDSAWKKIVLTKNNEKWVSNISYEHEDMDSGAVACTTDFRSEDNHGLVTNIKQETEANLQCASGLNVTPNTLYIVPGQCEPDLMLSEDDPLLEESGKQRVRRSSGPRQETPEARALRLTRMSAYASQRLANESPEQRALRLKRMSEYAARRLSTESPEQRAKRLARMSEYAARRIANETPEQRKERLKRMSAYAARRNARKKMQLDSTGSLESSPSFLSTLGLRSRFDQFIPTDPLDSVITETVEK